jgi:hypothetical protein
MINSQMPLSGLIAELEECLGRVDASGHAVAGAYLSSAIDSLRTSMIESSKPRGILSFRPSSLFTLH